MLVENEFITYELMLASSEHPKLNHRSSCSMTKLSTTPDSLSLGIGNNEVDH